VVQDGLAELGSVILRCACAAILSGANVAAVACSLLRSPPVTTWSLPALGQVYRRRHVQVDQREVVGERVVAAEIAVHADAGVDRDRVERPADGVDPVTEPLDAVVAAEVDLDRLDHRAGLPQPRGGRDDLVVLAATIRS
jgi:hypothetical protein